ncbi:MAG: hypothetical protein LBC03_05395, partial [Nitrososphaerota archaeon]|nr:hypothetical protein [Nitrososphaerota archaeon]
MQKSTVYMVFTLVFLLLISPVIAQITLNSDIAAHGNITETPSLTGGYEISQTSGICRLLDVSRNTVVISGSANSVFSAAFSYLSSGGNLTVKSGRYVGAESFTMNRCN